MSYIGDDIAAALASAAGRFGLFFRCQGPDDASTLRLWSGIQNRRGEMRSAGVIVAGDEEYIGLGVLLAAPEIDHIVDGTADDVNFSISMISSAVEPYLSAAAPKVRGRRVNLGLMAFGPDWQPTTPIVPIAQFTASHVQTALQPGESDTDPETSSLSLVAKNGDTSRSKGQPVHWITGQWKSRHGGSTFTDWVPRLQRGATVTWPKFG